MVNDSDQWQPTGERGRYRNPAGEEISRRQYLNIQAREVGFENYSQYQRLMRNTDYREIMLRETARRLDVPVKEVRSIRTAEGQEFNAIIANMIREGEFKPGAPQKGHIERGRNVEHLFDYWDIPESEEEAMLRRLKAGIRS